MTKVMLAALHAEGQLAEFRGSVQQGACAVQCSVLSAA